MTKKILVIDDEPAVRKSFELALKHLPYTVECAENGRLAMDRFHKDAFDLIYLDLKMPEMDGVETLYAIRELDKDIPVYIVTAFHKEFFGQLAGARRDQLDFELLMKPIGRDQIISVTQGILDGAQPIEGNDHV